MIPQPYPLFYGAWHGNKLEIGRIVGWHHPDNDILGNLQPIVLFDGKDGVAERLGYVEIGDGEDAWVRDSYDGVLAAMEATRRFRKEQGSQGASDGRR